MAARTKKYWWNWGPFEQNLLMNWEDLLARRTTQMCRSAVRELLKVTAVPDMISFAGGLPAPEFFPIQQVAEACDRVLARHGKRALQYGETEGVAELCDWIAGTASREGAIVERENVMIVSGAQQGLDLIGRILLDPGDTVVVENPTYLALLSAWRPLGAQFLPARSDEHGMCVEEFEPLFRANPKLVYCIPNFQNPSGTTLNLERREQLAELTRRYGVGVVEDDPYGELRFEGSALPSLFSIGSRLENMNTNPVIQVGTFSKTLAPGLRVGWIVAAKGVIERCVRAKQALDLHTSTLNQHIIYELIKANFLERHVPKLRQAYQERRDTMISALQDKLSARLQWSRPEGGMFLFATTRGEINTAELLPHALDHKVAFVSGEEFHVDGRGADTLRLNFSNAKPTAIREGVLRLAVALHEFEGIAGKGRPNQRSAPCRL